MCLSACLLVFCGGGDGNGDSEGGHGDDFDDVHLCSGDGGGERCLFAWCGDGSDGDSDGHCGRDRNDDSCGGRVDGFDDIHVCGE